MTVITPTGTPESLEALRRYVVWMQELQSNRGLPTLSAAPDPDYVIHHVTPCRIFPLKRKDPEANRPENLVFVTDAEHRQAHIMLKAINPILSPSLPTGKPPKILDVPALVEEAKQMIAAGATATAAQRKTRLSEAVIRDLWRAHHYGDTYGQAKAAEAAARTARGIEIAKRLAQGDYGAGIARDLGVSSPVVYKVAREIEAEGLTPQEWLERREAQG